PVPSRLQGGTRPDQSTITALVANPAVHRLYQARVAGTQELVALKTLHESRASDREEREMLAHEAWLGSRVAPGSGTHGDAGFIGVREPHEPSAFYPVFDWHGGHTLEQLQADGRRFDVPEVVEAGLAVA